MRPAPVVCIVRPVPTLQWMHFAMRQRDKVHSDCMLVCIIMLAHMCLFARFASHSSHNLKIFNVNWYFECSPDWRLPVSVCVCCVCACGSFSLFALPFFFSIRLSDGACLPAFIKHIRICIQWTRTLTHRRCNESSMFNCNRCLCYTCMNFIFLVLLVV